MRTLPYAALPHSLNDVTAAYAKPYDMPKEFRGVVPPELKADFMTTNLHPHQKQGLGNPIYERRQQIYPGATIHNVEKAVEHLSTHLVGFFVRAPLNWGLHQPVTDDPTKVTAANVDVAKYDDQIDSGKRV